MPGHNALAFASDIVLPILVALGLVASSIVVGLSLQRVTRGVGPAIPELTAAGFGILIAIPWIVLRIGTPTHALLVDLAVVFASAVLLVVARWRRSDRLTWTEPLTALGAAALALAGSLMPFVASGRFGIPGVGINDDTAAHMSWLAYIMRTGKFPPGVFEGGYPTGPHSLMAAMLQLVPGDAIEAVFVGFMLAVQMLIAVVVLGALRDVRPVPRAIIAGAVPLVYLNAAYFAQGAYKEPLTAMFVLALAVLVGSGMNRQSTFSRPSMVVGALAMSFGIYLSIGPTGFVWAIALLGVAMVVTLFRRGRSLLLSGVFLVSVGVCLGVVLAVGFVLRHMLAIQIQSVRALPTTGGNLPGYLPSLEAMGIWRASDFRQVPANVVVAGALAGCAAIIFIWASVWWIRRGKVTVPVVVATTIVMYAISRPDQGPYWVAKLLVIMSPGIALIILGALAGDAREYGWRSLSGATRTALGVLYLGLAMLSTLGVFLATPVSSMARTDELASIRRTVGDKSVLFLGQDYYIAVKLRSANVAHLFPYSTGLDPRIATPSGALPALGEMVDFDDVTVETLDKFEYVLTTNTRHQSDPPSNWHAVAHTDSYELFRRAGATDPRVSHDETGVYGWSYVCGAGQEDLGIASVRPRPVQFTPDGWTDASGVLVNKGGTTLTLGQLNTVTQSRALSAGSWDFVLQYLSPVRLHVTVGTEHFVLPAEPDVLGQRWPIGRVHLDGSKDVKVKIETEAAAIRTNAKYILIANLSASKDTPATPTAPPACGAYVDWASPGSVPLPAETTAQ